MIVSVKSSNLHQMIHFCVDIVIAIATSMWGQQMMFQIFYHVKRKVKGSIVAIIVPLAYKRLKIYVLVAYIIKNFSKKNVIIFLIVCFQTTNIIVPTIDLIIGLSPLEFHKQNWSPTNSSSHGGSKNDGFEKGEIWIPKITKHSRWLEVLHFGFNLIK